MFVLARIQAHFPVFFVADHLQTMRLSNCTACIAVATALAVRVYFTLHVQLLKQIILGASHTLFVLPVQNICNVAISFTSNQ